MRSILDPCQTNDLWAERICNNIGGIEPRTRYTYERGKNTGTVDDVENTEKKKQWESGGTKGGGNGLIRAASLRFLHAWSRWRQWEKDSPGEMVMYEVLVPPDSLQRPPAHYFLTPRVRTSADVEVWFWAPSNFCCETTNRFSRSTAMFSASLRRPSSCCIAKDEGLVSSGASGTASSKNLGNEPASASFNDSNNLSLSKREPASKLLNSSPLK